jgi:hypothetical protein
VNQLHVAIAGMVGALLSACSTFSNERATRQHDTTQWMLAQEKAWAQMACGGKAVANDLFADDFQGTAPGGGHYGKPTGKPTYDPDTKWSTDCQLDDADVRFFGPHMAVVYGKESRTVPLPEAGHERRCLVWTDTWLERNGKWQMIAVQDGRMTCPQK